MKHLVLVDYENVHRIDLSVLDDSYRAIIFVGANQCPPKAATRQTTAHRFERVDFQKISGSGKNALDFHIAFHLGRTYEIAPETVCIVVSRDKGYDPLLQHLNHSGLRCRRVESFDALVESLSVATDTASITPAASVACGRCRNGATVEHLGGRWCPTCGRFASAPDPALLPSRQPGYLDSVWRRGGEGQQPARAVCGWCHSSADMSDGIYDDGEWMCGGCIAQYAR